MNIRLRMMVVYLWLAAFLAGCAVVLPSGDTVDIPLYAEPDPQAKVDTFDTTTLVDNEPVEISLRPLSSSAPLLAHEIFQMVSPAIAYVNTPRGSGSAVLVEPGYLVTNAHVVWPYNSVRIAFPDGNAYDDVSVVAWDLVADLAILAAPDTGVTPLPFVDGTELPIGSDVYLIGYPGEFEDFPQPALTKGLLSRVRQWETIDLALFQVDADVAGGQSGGVLVSERSEIIGISTFYFTEARYGLVSSAADIAPRLTTLLNQETVAFNDRRPLQEEGKTEHSGRLDDTVSQHLYFLDAEPGSKVRLSVEGVGRPSFAVHDSYGLQVAESSSAVGTRETALVTIQEGGPYLVFVKQESINRNRYTLSSSHPLVAVHDPDDGVILAVGEERISSLDAPGDVDRYEIQLEKGDRIAIDVDSMVVDPVAILSYETYGRVEVIYDDDNGPPGLFGLGARLFYAAPEDGIYTILVGDLSDASQGGYYLTVSEPDAAESLTEPYVSQEFYDTNYGRMQLYESANYDFAMKLPDLWRAAECGDNVTACFEGENYRLMIVEENVANLPQSQRNISASMDLQEQVTVSNLPDGRLLIRKPMRTRQGLRAETATFSYYNGLGRMYLFVYMAENDVAFNVSYMVMNDTAEYDQTDQFAAYLFSSFRVLGEEYGEQDALFHLDEGMRLAAQAAYEEAIAVLTKSIELDPYYSEAYRVRARVYNTVMEYDRALADWDRAQDLEPDGPGLYNARALTFWYKHEYANALAESERGIELFPETLEIYQTRALIRAASADYEGALAELDRYAELTDDELSPAALDMRAYVYVKMRNFAAAREDYEAVLDQDFKSAATLLGAGISYAHLGDREQATFLLNYGLELLAESDFLHIDPQLADLAGQAQAFLESALAHR